ncbi:dihydrofolate reductase family protein [Intrasporangium sp. DVR]|uniref:dihydrofolate reductase family protein n=1 Tax=Intrasporangium sp. DVR TaxID=3127867 RepID=UPI00313A503F
MRQLNAWLYMTLDGVVEAPENWVVPDEEMFDEQTALYARSDALLLGRRTFDVFAASWPERGSEVPNADWMNETPKFVATSAPLGLTWNNTSVLDGDIVETVARLKQGPGGAITLNGSTELLRTLLVAGLVDELRLFVQPVLVGSGRRLFDAAGSALDLGLRASRAYKSGSVSLTYGFPQPDEGTARPRRS